MAKEVMRHAKAKGKANIRNIEKHNQAAKETVEQIRANEIKTTGTTSICIENLKYNYALEKCENFNEKIDKVIQEKMPGKTIRKDAVKLLDGIYTMSPDKIKFLECRLHIDGLEDCEETKQAKKEWREKHKEWMDEYKALTKEQRQACVQEDYEWIKEYAKKCVEFEKKHYGICISAEVHFHEETVHIHTSSIPLVKGNEGNWKLNAKDIMGNKTKLAEMQTLFHEEVGKEMGLERGTCRTNSEIKKHTTKLQKQTQDLEVKLADLQSRYSTLEANYENLKEDYQDLKNQYAEIMKLYTSLDGRISTCNEQISKNIYKMATASKKALYEQIQATSKAQETVEDFIKSGKAPDIIFGSMRKLNHEVQKLENLIEEEDWER